MDSISGLFENYPSVIAIASFLILFFIFILASVAVRWIWKHVLTRLIKNTTSAWKYLFAATSGAIQLVFIAAGFYFCHQLYGGKAVLIFDHIPMLDTSVIENLVNHVSVLFLLTAVVFFLWRAVFSLFSWYEIEIAPKTKTHLDEKIVPSFRLVMKIFILVFVAMFVSDHFGWELNKLWAAAGIGSLAIALAAKDTFANIISGIIILIDRPFLVGDRVELADGTFGDVVNIGFRSTKILSFDNTLHILPNQEISNQRITNHAYPDFKIKIRHNIGVAYGTDLDRVKEIINDILKSHPDVLNEPEWGIYFMEFGDSSLNLLVIYWVSNYTRKFSIIDQINMLINKRFEQENIEIPFPQRDIHMRQ